MTYASSLYLVSAVWRWILEDGHVPTFWLPLYDCS